MKKSCAIIAAILSLCMLCACGAIQPAAADTPAPTQAPANPPESAAPSPEVTEAPENGAFLMPVFGTVLAWVFLGEQIPLSSLLGGVLILTGVGLTLRK